jgi:hypothetical protein
VVLVAVWLVACHGPYCDSVACIEAETVTVTGIPSGGHPWSVTVCTDTSDCASGTVDIYQSVVLVGPGDASATTGRVSADSRIELSVSMDGAVVTDGRPVHVTVRDAKGDDVTTVDHIIHLASENVGDSDCPVMCPESRVTGSDLPKARRFDRAGWSGSAASGRRNFGRAEDGIVAT